MLRPSASKRLALNVVLAAMICSTTIVIQPAQCQNSINQQEVPLHSSDGGQAAATKADGDQAAAPKSSGAQEPAAAPAAIVVAHEQAPASKSAAPESKPAESERQGRASDEPESAKPETKDTDQKSKDDKAAAAAAKPAESQDKKAKSGQASSSLRQQQQQQQQQSQLSGKSGQKSKLPANLGTVTSTGSGGHYMSKHDAYSAIAEKHGALAQDAMRHTHRVAADRRNHLQRFGGIQKASGISDMMNPFKGVTDSGLARTLGASMRSIMKSKYSIPAYLASAALGAVALLAFYESPISPLPVPSLPEPPVGRFPPEMPNISPSVQVPFRMNQQGQQFGQQAYANQRSYPGAQMPQQQQQQVLFPGVSAQQRQMTSNSGGPVQQLAANLFSSVGSKQQSAQRKSGPDYELSSSRSLFGTIANSPQRLGAPANQQQQHQKQSSSFLSYFGLGGGASGVSQSIPTGESQSAASSSASSSIEPKGQAALSNSHVVNKVKSYFARAPVAPGQQSSSGGGSQASGALSNPYDQYQRMSFMQALAKDTAFLPAFLNPNRKSSQASPGSSSGAGQSSSGGSSAAANAIQQSINNVLSAAAGKGSSSSSQQIPAASRMQVDGHSYGIAPAQQQQQQQQQAQSGNKRASSGFGLMRAADRIAHALIDTVTSGLMQRNAPVASGAQQQQQQHNQHQQTADGAAHKSPSGAMDESPLMSTASLIGDIMLSSYAAGGQQQQASNLVNSLAQAAGLASMANGELNQQQSANNNGNEKTKTSSDGQNEQASARSDQQAAIAEQAAPAAVVSSPEQARSASAPAVAAKQQSSSASSAAQSQSASHEKGAHVRKTRSIGLEYPTYELSNIQQTPSTATQINNLVDLMSDSYRQNKMLFNFVMNRVGLSQALPYVDQILGDGQVGIANRLIR